MAREPGPFDVIEGEIATTQIIGNGSAGLPAIRGFNTPRYISHPEFPNMDSRRFLPPILSAAGEPT